MATFWIKTKNKYSVDTYQNTKNTYDWIMKALTKGMLDFDDLDVDFLFTVAEITCSCNGIEEFIENAYGQVGYRLTQMAVTFSVKEAGRVRISVEPNDCVSISTTTKSMLEKIVNLLENTSLDETEANDPISVTYIETQINNDGVIVHGNQNNVANNHSEIEIEQEQGDSGVKSFLSGILQNITSNFIWYLLTFGAGIVIAYLTKS